MEAGRRALVRLPNWIGDLLFCTPALSALKASHPGLHLTALAKAKVLAAAEALPFFDEVRTLRGTGIAGTLHEARALSGERFDSAIVFPKGFREALLVRLAGIPVRIGLDTDHRRFLLSHPVAFSGKDWKAHHVKQFAKVLEPLGIKLGNEGLTLPVSAEWRNEARRLLSGAGVVEPFVVFHTTASKAERAWHSERFGEMAARLERETNLRPVLLGTRAERHLHEGFVARCPSAVDLAGETTFGGMVALIAKSALFVGNDSGPMHVAAAVETPLVAIFGPGAPVKTAPYTSKVPFRVVYADLPCSPCRQSFWKDCSPTPSGKPPCLEAVSSSAVFRACLEVLKRNSS